MRRAIYLLILAALAGCAAPGWQAQDELRLGPPMELGGPLTGYVTISAPAGK